LFNQEVGCVILLTDQSEKYVACKESWRGVLQTLVTKILRPTQAKISTKLSDN